MKNTSIMTLWWQCGLLSNYYFDHLFRYSVSLCLEKVQERATKLAHCMKNLSYSERLNKPDSTHLRGGYVVIYWRCSRFWLEKMLIVSSSFSKLITAMVSETTIWLFFNCRKYFFSQDSVGKWNQSIFSEYLLKMHMQNDAMFYFQWSIRWNCEHWCLFLVNCSLK